MKRTARAMTYSALVILGLFVAAPAHAQFGIAAGLNFENAGDVQFTTASGTVENATGYHFGLFYDLSAGPLAIRPGVFYRQIENITFRTGNDVGSTTESFDLSMVDIPVDLRLRLPMTLVAPYVLAGPVFSFTEGSTDQDFTDRVKNLQMGANIGAGIEVNVPILGVKLMPEARYSFALGDYVEDYSFLGANVEVQGDPSSKMNSFMLRLNVGF